MLFPDAFAGSIWQAVTRMNRPAWIIAREGGIIGEILVEIFLAGQHRSPWRFAGSAIIECTANAPACGIAGGLEQFVSGGRAGEQCECFGSGSPVVARELVLPSIDSRRVRNTAVFDFDHRRAVRGEFDVDLLACRLAIDIVGKHRRTGGVFMIYDQQASRHLLLMPFMPSVRVTR